jgi:hypothetical protein
VSSSASGHSATLSHSRHELEAFLDGEREQRGKLDGHVVNLPRDQGTQQPTFLGNASNFGGSLLTANRPRFATGSIDRFRAP